MKYVLVLIISLTFLGIDSYGQFGYTSYQEVDGLKLSTKWGKARDADGVKKPALLLAFENTNTYPVGYSFDIMLYYEGMLRENGQMEDLCLAGLKSSVGKLNGIFFIPEKFTEEQLKNSDFNFEIEKLVVEKIESCTEVDETIMDDE